MSYLKVENLIFPIFVFFGWKCFILKGGKKKLRKFDSKADEGKLVLVLMF